MANIDKLLVEMKKKFGDNAAMYAKDIPPYRVSSCGSLGLDYATGIGGIPSNRVVEFGGEPGSGKSTLAMYTVSNRLKAETEWGTNRGALYLDIENRITPDWLAMFVDEPERVIVAKPDSMEQATDMYMAGVRSGEIGIVVVDSIGGAPTERVMDKSASVGDYGGNSLAVSRFARLASTLSGKYDVTTLGINQVREDLSGYRRYIVPGGKAWLHATSLRIELKIRRQQGDKATIETPDGPEQVGYPVVAKIHKNSLGSPFKSTFWWFYNVPTEEYGFGIDQPGEVARLAITTEVVKRVSAQSYEHPSFGKLVGRNNVLARIKDDPEVFHAVLADVQATLETGNVAGVIETFDDYSETGNRLLVPEPFANVDANEYRLDRTA